MGLLIVIFCMALFSSPSASCPPGEYQINELCCPMCNSGTVVKTHCSSTASSNVCIPCVKGTYMDHPNGVTKCAKCTECDTGAGLLEKKECTYTSDTVCDCKPGYYCSGENSPCDLCRPQRICTTGQYVKVQGTTKTDHECEDCPPGHFSTENMAITCQAWTKCSELDQVQSMQGTFNSNSVCVDRRRHLAIIPACVPLVIILLILYLKDGIRKKEYKDCHNQPVQETVNRTE